MSAIHWGHGKTEARGGYTSSAKRTDGAMSQGEARRVIASELLRHNDRTAKIVGGITLGILAGLGVDMTLAVAFPHLMSTYANLYSFDMQHGAPLSFIGGAELFPIVPVAFGGFFGAKVAAR